MVYYRLNDRKSAVDMSIKTESTRAAIVVLGYLDLTPLESVLADTPLIFPYIPGLLAFR